MKAASDATDEHLDKVAHDGRRLDRLWMPFLGSLALCAWFLSAFTFWPGFMSPDSLGQLEQALTGEFNDWHPPIMALMWRMLILGTGSVGSLLALQLFVEWVSLLGLALVIYRTTSSRAWSLAALAIGLLPGVIGLSGVIWKDIQMAFALLAATVLALWLNKARDRGRIFWVGVVLVLLLLAYAAMVRKNALVATPPVVYLVYLSWPQRRKLRLAVLAGGLVGIIILLQAVVTFVARPEVTHQTQFIPVDDIVHTMSADEIRQAGFTPNLESRLLIAHEMSVTTGSLFNAYTSFYPLDGPNHGVEILRRWPGLMLDRPIAYALYRTQAFSTFLFDYRVVWMEGTDPNPYVGILNSRLVPSLKTYVLRADTSLGIMFVPALWFAISIWLMVRRRGSALWGLAPRMLGISSFLYTLTYIPSAPATDYRYSYWPVMACCVALLLIFVDKCSTRLRDPDPAQGRRL